MSAAPPVSHVRFGGAEIDALRCASARARRGSFRGSSSGTDTEKAGAFEETLAWVRAKSTERRRRYRRHLGQKEGGLDGVCSELTDKIVTESLERGRAALADAEEHMRMFEEYLRPPEGEGEGEGTGGTDATDRAPPADAADGGGIVAGGDEEAVRQGRRAAVAVVVSPRRDRPDAPLPEEGAAVRQGRRAVAVVVSPGRDRPGGGITDVPRPLPAAPLPDGGPSDGANPRRRADAVERLDAMLTGRAVGGKSRRGESRRRAEGPSSRGTGGGAPAGGTAGSDPERGGEIAGRTGDRGPGDGSRDPPPDDGGGEDSGSISASRHATTNMIDAIINEGEKRARTEELIAYARLRGDRVDSVLRERDGLNEGHDKGRDGPRRSPVRPKPAPTTPVFDPTQMRGAQRSAIKAAVRAEEEAAADAAARDRARFRARPLPRGGRVNNDLYKLTKAAMGKRIVPDGGGGGSRGGAIRMDASVLLEQRGMNECRGGEKWSEGRDRMGNQTSDRTSDVHTKSGAGSKTKRTRSFSEADGATVRRNKLFDAKRLLDEVDRSIFIEDDGRIDHEDGDDDRVEDDVRAISDLHHNIARLEAELRRKRAVRRDKVAEFEDLDAPPSLHAGISAWNVGEPEQELDASEAGHSAGEEHRDDDDDDDDDDDCGSLYARHERWVKERRRRIDLARIRSEDLAMRDVTGAPRLDGNTESWERAKAAHEEAARRAKMNQERRERERGEREAEFRRQKLREMEEMREEAARKKRALRGGVDRGRQRAAVEKLSRPKKAGDAQVCDWEEAPEQSSEDEDEDGAMDASLSEGEGPDRRGKANGADVLSFADMDDRQFAKMMKLLGIRTKRGNGRGGGKSTFASCSLTRRKDNHNKKKKKWKGSVREGGDADSSGACEHLESNMASEDACTEPLSNPENDESSERRIDDPKRKGEAAALSVEAEADLDAADILKKRYTSSEAQARLMKKLTSPDLYEYTVANASSALAAAETQLDLLDRKDDGEDGAEKAVDCGQFHILEGGGEEPTKEEPYERYERGGGAIPFFDRSSSSELGRFRVRDARDFRPDTMRRRSDDGGNPKDGIMLLVGKREEGRGGGEERGGDEGREGGRESEEEELVITILFDRTRFDEGAAFEWWTRHRRRFVSDPAELSTDPVAEPSS